MFENGIAGRLGVNNRRISYLDNEEPYEEDRYKLRGILLTKDIFEIKKSSTIRGIDPFGIFVFGNFNLEF